MGRTEIFFGCLEKVRIRRIDRTHDYSPRLCARTTLLGYPSRSCLTASTSHPKKASLAYAPGIILRFTRLRSPSISSSHSSLRLGKKSLVLFFCVFTRQFTGDYQGDEASCCPERFENCSSPVSLVVARLLLRLEFPRAPLRGCRPRRRLWLLAFARRP